MESAVPKIESKNGRPRRQESDGRHRRVSLPPLNCELCDDFTEPKQTPARHLCRRDLCRARAPGRPSPGTRRRSPCRCTAEYRPDAYCWARKATTCRDKLKPGTAHTATGWMHRASTTDLSQRRIQMRSTGHMVQDGTGMMVLKHRLEAQHADMGRTLTLSDVDNTTETWTCSPS